MYFLKSCKMLIALSSLAILQACAPAPHVEEWNRERISQIPSDDIEIAICFDRASHTREQVLNLAREECRTRITEVQNLVQYKELGQVKYLNSAEGPLFAGPVERKRRLQAILASLKLAYMENDVWTCPIATPYRAKFKCLYDPNATDSSTQQQSTPLSEQNIELPPELPADLKPQ